MLEFAWCGRILGVKPRPEEVELLVSGKVIGEGTYSVVRDDVVSGMMARICVRAVIFLPIILGLSVLGFMRMGLHQIWARR
jgi:hypothetical protein